jgi:hypothetical protein
MILIYILKIVQKSIMILSKHHPIILLPILLLFFINRDLEASVEELQNDVKSKQCHVTINDVESFAFVLSTISRSLVDLKSRNNSSIKSGIIFFIFKSYFSDITRKTFFTQSTINDKVSAKNL